jgi:flagellar protein FliO/FliZ
MLGDSALLSLLWVLVCVVVILGLAYWVTRYLAAADRRGLFGKSKGTDHLAVLSRLTLGKDQQLVLIRAGDRYLLLGVTTAQMTSLAEFTKEEAESWQMENDQPPDDQQPPSFGQALHSVLQQKGRR